MALGLLVGVSRHEYITPDRRGEKTRIIDVTPVKAHIFRDIPERCYVGDQRLVSLAAVDSFWRRA
jgi:hypothetical protein